MSFRSGDTFLFPLGQDAQREHLWIIATEPNRDGLFAVVSFTTLKGAKDQTVILRKAEHPFLRWDTCVAYALAEIMSVDKLRNYIDCSTAKMHVRATEELLKLVLDGFSASAFTKNRVREFVLAHKASRSHAV